MCVSEGGGGGGQCMPDVIIYHIIITDYRLSDVGNSR